MKTNSASATIARPAGNSRTNRKLSSEQFKEVAFIAPGMADRSDHEVRRSLERLSKRERKITIEVLLHLIEVEKRKIFAKAGFGSLFDYCTRALRYSESAAGRRIRAARCLRDYPIVLALLSAGEVSICSISAIAGILNWDNHEIILQAIRGKSKREIDRIVAEAKPGCHVRERVVPVKIRKSGAGCDTGSQSGSPSLSGRTESESPQADLLQSSNENRPVSDRRGGGRGFTTLVPSGTPPIETANSTGADPGNGESRFPAESMVFKIEFAADEEFVAMMDQVRSVMSGRSPQGLSLKELFGHLMDEWLERHGPRKREARRQRREKIQKREKKRVESAGVEGVKATLPERGESRPRHIPARVRDQVQIRDGGRCTWVAPDGTRCPSTWDLEIDHIHPFALGGDHSPDNLRLLCAAHNRLEGERRFGLPG